MFKLRDWLAMRGRGVELSHGQDGRYSCTLVDDTLWLHTARGDSLWEATERAHDKYKRAKRAKEHYNNTGGYLQC